MPTDAKSYEIPRSEEKLIKWAEQQREGGYRLPEREGKENLAFFLGKQFGVWNTERRRFDNPRQATGDPNAPVRVPVNKIAGLGERVIARLTKNAPVPECRPVTDTDTDVDAARVGTRILDHEMNRLSWQQRLVELYFWVMPLGWSFFHVRWDPEDGASVGADPETGEPVPQGEVAYDEVPAFELVLDPNARRFRDARWAIRTVAMTKDAVYEQYGVPADECEGADAQSEDWRFSDTLGGYSTADGPRGNARKDKGSFVAVHQLWLRPGGRTRPEGLVFTWSGKTVLEAPLPFPYEHGRLPFVPFNLLPALGGGPAGRTWVTDLVPMQKDYNDARSREATIRRMLSPKILAARGQIDPNRLTSRVEVIDFNPTGPAPTLMLPDGRWMAQFEQGMNRADAEMGDRAGQAEVSQGKAASSAPAAAILALQEADESKLAVSAKELAASVQDLGWQTLMLVKQFWTEERTVRTWSRDGELEVAHFSASDLGNQLDVHVSSESALPKSKSARVQLAIDLRTAGVLGQGLDADRNFVRMLDLPGTDFVLETLNKVAKQAEREHARLLALEPFPIPAWHDHTGHIGTHLDHMMSEEYERYDPDQKAMFEAHLFQHQATQLQQALGGVGSAGQPPALGPEVPGVGPDGNPTGANGEYNNPLTGAPQDPLAVAAGLAPSSLQGAQAQIKNGRGVIGGTGRPGPVPGVSRDTQAARQGD